jgi:hypothetical protein
MVIGKAGGGERPAAAEAPTAVEIPQPAVAIAEPPAAAPPVPVVLPPAMVAKTPGLPILSISETNRLSKEFQLTSTQYLLNGEPLNTPRKGNDASHPAITGLALEGANTLEVLATARGTARRALPYLKNLDFGTSDKKTFTAKMGDAVNVDSVVFEKDDLKKSMVDRVHVKLTVTVVSAPTASRE